MRTHILVTITHGVISENIKANFKNSAKPCRYLQRLVQSVVGRNHPFFNLFGSVDGIIAVQLKHGAGRSLRLRCVDLNLIIILRMKTTRAYEEDKYQEP